MITNGLAILIGAVILAVYLIYAIIRKRPVKRIVVTCIFIIYLVGVAIVTLFPIVHGVAVKPMQYIIDTPLKMR